MRAPRTSPIWDGPRTPIVALFYVWPWRTHSTFLIRPRLKDRKCDENRTCATVPQPPNPNLSALNFGPSKFLSCPSATTISMISGVSPPNCLSQGAHSLHRQAMLKHQPYSCIHLSWGVRSHPCAIENANLGVPSSGIARMSCYTVFTMPLLISGHRSLIDHNAIVAW